MKRVLRSSVIVLITLVLIGCAGRTSTPVREAPLEPEKQEDLRRTLSGTTWGVEFVTETPDRHNREKKKSHLTWHFESDGTGVMHQKIAENVPMVGGQEEKEQFNWKLEGRNLIFSPGSSERTYFRVETWSDDEMMWFNYEGSNYFIVYPVE